MRLGKNIQYLRKQKKITQEQMASEMSVFRQIVSKWEADEVVPELDEIVTMCVFFPTSWMIWFGESWRSRRILVHWQENRLAEKLKENILSYFEYVYEINGKICMDIFIHANSISNEKVFINFSQRHIRYG